MPNDLPSPMRLDPAPCAGDRELDLETTTPTRLDQSGASARFFYGKEIGVEDSALPFIVLGLPVPPRDQPVQIAKIYHHLFLRMTAMLRRQQESLEALQQTVRDLTEGLLITRKEAGEVYEKLSKKRLT